MTNRQRPRVESVDRGRWRVTGRTAFLAVLLVVLVAYTLLGLELDWRTGSGRIGPGFFPRIVGSLASALTLILLLRSLQADLRAGRAEPAPVRADDEGGVVGEGDSGGHLRPMLVMVAASFLLMAVYTALGAIVACALFLLATLSYFNRGRTVMNLVISIVLPVAVYLLFQSFLNAGLPSGILPRF